MEPQDRPPLVSLWDLAAILAFGALWLWYQNLVPGLPDPVPTHFDAAGRANGWTSKAALPFVIFGLPVGIWAVLTAIGMALGATRADAAGARALAMAPLRGLLGVGFAFLMGACLDAAVHGPRAVLIGVAGFLACVVAGVAALARAFARLPRTTAQDQFYRWGLFYVNPADPRVLVEKRLGVGLTLNFARPAAWVCLALMLLPLAAVLLFLRTRT